MRELSSSESYRHTQFGTLMVVLMSLSLVVTVAASAASGWHAAPLVIGVLMALLLLNLHSMTVAVTDEAVKIRLGPGWIRKTIPLAAIGDARADSIGLLWGWGFRYRPGQGWMWNVSGFQVVRLDLVHGRQFRIGTDDPEGLARAIQKAKYGSKG